MLPLLLGCSPSYTLQTLLRVLAKAEAVQVVHRKAEHSLCTVRFTVQARLPPFHSTHHTFLEACGLSVTGTVRIH